MGELKKIESDYRNSIIFKFVTFVEVEMEKKENDCVSIEPNEVLSKFIIDAQGGGVPITSEVIGALVIHYE